MCLHFKWHWKRNKEQILKILCVFLCIFMCFYYSCFMQTRTFLFLLLLFVLIHFPRLCVIFLSGMIFSFGSIKVVMDNFMSSFACFLSLGDRYIKTIFLKPSPKKKFYCIFGTSIIHPNAFYLVCNRTQTLYDHIQKCKLFSLCDEMYLVCLFGLTISGAQHGHIS